MRDIWLLDSWVSRGWNADFRTLAWINLLEEILGLLDRDVFAILHLVKVFAHASVDVERIQTDGLIDASFRLMLLQALDKNGLPRKYFQFLQKVRKSDLFGIFPEKRGEKTDGMGFRNA